MGASELGNSKGVQAGTERCEWKREFELLSELNSPAHSMDLRNSATGMEEEAQGRVECLVGR